MATSESRLRAIDKYNLTHYARLDVRIPKDLSVKFADKCEEMGASKRSVVIQLIEEFLANE